MSPWLRPGSPASASVKLLVADGVCATWDQAQARLGFLHKRPGHPDRPAPPLEYWTSERAGAC